MAERHVASGRQKKAHRGVSSTVKLPVSKTGLGGSNPSAPARFCKGAFRRWPFAFRGKGWGEERKASSEQREVSAAAQKQVADGKGSNNGTCSRRQTGGNQGMA